MRRDLALVGAGRWGQNLARNFFSLGALGVLCDQDSVKCEQFQALYPPIQTTTNFQEVLDNPKMKKVAIAAPAPFHYTLVKEALLHGKDVFVEKPLCFELDEALELCALAENGGCILMVGHILRYHPCVQAIEQQIQKGTLGELRYLSSSRLNFGPFRPNENVIFDFAPHDLSLLLGLTPFEPKEVKVSATNALFEEIDTATLDLIFPGSLLGHISVSWTSPFKEQKLVIVGTEGMLTFDDTKSWKEKVEITPLKGRVQGETRVLHVSQGEPLREECHHFLSCCRTRVPPKTGGEEALKGMRVLDQVRTKIELALSIS